MPAPLIAVAAAWRTLPARARGALAVAAIAALALAHWTYTQRRDAAQEAVAKIEEQDNAAISAAEAAAMGWRECVDNSAGGLQWDYVAAKCVRSGPGAE